MKFSREKLLRAGIAALTFPLPREPRRRLQRSLRGRLEIAQFRAADCTVLSRAKSGRTWLRAMLSRLYQLQFGLPERELLEFDNFHRRDPRAPKVAFTHGHALGELFDRDGAAAVLGNRRLLFLVRHPCDVAVSEFFQSTRRAGAAKRELFQVDGDLSMFEFVVAGPQGLPSIIAYLNDWYRRLRGVDRALCVRYEDMRAEPEHELGRIVSFLGIAAGGREIRDAVEFASFENLREKERTNFFRNDRLAPADPDDPDSFKVRRARVGGFRDYFTAEQTALMERIVSEQLVGAWGYAGEVGVPALPGAALAADT
jgi:hypothetical protein